MEGSIKILRQKRTLKDHQLKTHFADQITLTTKVDKTLLSVLTSPFIISQHNGRISAGKTSFNTANDVYVEWKNTMYA